MTNTVFNMLNKNVKDEVNLDEFQKFILENPNHIKLFNFVSSDAYNKRYNIKLKRNFLNLLRTTEELSMKITLLEQVMFPNQESKKSITNQRNSFNANFRNTLKEIERNKRNSSNRKFSTITDFQQSDEDDDKEL